MREVRTKAISLFVMVLVACLTGAGIAQAVPAPIEGTEALDEASLVASMTEAGVDSDDIPALIEKLKRGETPDSMRAEAVPVSETPKLVNDERVIVYRYADGSATTVADSMATVDPAPGQVVPFGIAVGKVTCSKRTTGSTTTYTGCNVWAAYLIGKAQFKFDATKSGGKTKINRVYGASCQMLVRCNSPKIVRSTSSSSQHALAELAVNGSPVKGVGWTQHLIVRITNKGVMTAYADYSYI